MDRKRARTALRRVQAPSRESAVFAPLEFTPSPERTLGMELEFQLVDPITKDLVPLAPLIIKETERDPWLASRVHHELMENTVEIVTGRRDDGGFPRTPAELREDLERSIAAVSEIARRSGCELLLAGSHPFADPQQQSFTPDPRIRSMINEMGEVVRNLQTFGLHVHVGVPDGDAAIRAMNHLNNYLPHFLALSGSSPFWNGRETRSASHRSPTFEEMRLTGPPPVMRGGWASYVARFRKLVQKKRIADGGTADPWAGNKDIHWDVRPSPKYGTIELRVCDATPTLHEAAALAALAQCLVEEAVLQTGPVATLDDFDIRDNKNAAAESGLDAIIDIPGSSESVYVRTDIEATVKRLQPIAQELGCAKELNDILGILRDGPSADRQRAVYDASVRASPARRVPRAKRGQPRSTEANRAALTQVVGALQDELQTDRPRRTPVVLGGAAGLS